VAGDRGEVPLAEDAVPQRDVAGVLHHHRHLEAAAGERHGQAPTVLSNFSLRPDPPGSARIRAVTARRR